MRQKYESREVRIHAGIIIIIHKFSRALLDSERAECACSHIYKLPIIHPDTRTLRKTEVQRDRQKRGRSDISIYV